MITYNPPRPTSTDEIRRKAAEEFVIEQIEYLPQNIKHEDLVNQLVKHTYDYEEDYEYIGGYEIAKILEDLEGWDIKTRTVIALGSFHCYVKRHLKTVEAEWIEKNNIQPPFPVGTEVEYPYGSTWKQGEITGICTHTPGCYLIKEAGQNDEECHKMRGIVKWENVRQKKIVTI